MFQTDTTIILARLLRDGVEATAKRVNENIGEEGWCLSQCYGSSRGDGYFEIQRDDHADMFDGDHEAVDYVVARAASGSEVHRDALLVVLFQENKPKNAFAIPGKS